MLWVWVLMLMVLAYYKTVVGGIRGRCIVIWILIVLARELGVLLVLLRLRRILRTFLVWAFCGRGLMACWRLFWIRRDC